MMEYSPEIKRHSFLHKNPKLTEVFSPRASRGTKPREKDKASPRHVGAQDADGRPLFPPKFPGNYQKLWPSRVSVGAEELVKHMSNVPVYLQRAEKGDNVQEKALNFGVLDWGRLEKWTDNHRRASVNGDALGSPVSSNASSSFSTFESSSQSCRSSASRCINQRNQSPSVNRHRDSSADDDNTHISEVASRISHDTGCPLPEVTPRKCPVRRRISFSIERYQPMDNLPAKYEENKRSIPGSEEVPDSLGHSTGASALPSRSKNSELSNSVNGKTRPCELGSGFRETSRGLGHVCHSTSPCTKGLFRLDDGLLDHFQESIQGNRRFSFASTINIPTEPGRASCNAAFPSDDFHFAPLSPSVPRSCPLTSNIHKNGWSDMNASSSDLARESVPFVSITSAQHSNEVQMLRVDGWHRKNDKYAIKLQKSSAAETPGRWHRSGKNAFTKGGEKSSTNNQSNADLTRSSSLSESSDTKQEKWTSLTSQNPDRETDISKSRRSPLRRLLDPLLKPKAFHVGQAAGLAAGSPRLSLHETKLPTLENLVSNKDLQSLFHLTTRSSSGDAVKGITPSSCMGFEKQDSVYDKKHEAPSKQALLQLSWKNGVPLFTLSVNEGDILAATRKNDTSSKEDYECMYTFYYVCEIKKKIGGWINQVNKGRRKELVSNIVGQMNVSRLRCPKNHFVVREFVLFGRELRPTTHETLDPIPNTELAAIVLRVPEKNIESFIDNLPHINNIGHLLRPNLERGIDAFSPVGNPGNWQIVEKNSPKMVAILPSEVHGLSDTGKPATLVERWKSGGQCDCGGWDVGCPLTILTNNLQDGTSSCVQSSYAMDGTPRVELFIQGGGQEGKPLFSLVAFKEGLYTVDFHASIEVLQAFAVCIAILHGRKPRGPYELQGSRLCNSVEGCLLKIPAGKQVDSAMSVPYHPPLSPVGRA